MYGRGGGGGRGELFDLISGNLAASPFLLLFPLSITSSAAAAAETEAVVKSVSCGGRGRERGRGDV